jgi:hypothetical protein
MASGRCGSFVLGKLFARALTGGKVSGCWREKQKESCGDAHGRKLG